MLRAKLNYKRLNKEYLQNKRRKAAEELKQLAHFTHWPTAKSKETTEKKHLDNDLTIKAKQNKLLYLPFYTYQRKSYDQKQIPEERVVVAPNKKKVKKQF